MISDDQRRQTAATQAALREDIDWVHQPTFDKTFADLTGTEPESDEWRRETNWNFTGDDVSYAQ
jgi:hypothetical protein